MIAQNHAKSGISGLDLDILEVKWGNRGWCVGKAGV